jgi:hypothetical protein
MAIRLPLFRPELDPVDHIEIPTPCSVPWDSMYSFSGGSSDFLLGLPFVSVSYRWN